MDPLKTMKAQGYTCGLVGKALTPNTQEALGLILCAS